METHLLHSFERVAKWPMYIVIVIILASMFFGAADLFIQFGTELISPDPYPFVLHVSELLGIFSLSLIIVVGYELIKSIILVVKSDLIPVDAITKIAAIAVLNKMITADYGAVDAYKIAAMALILLSIGAAYHFFRRK
jgi:uncharacterized membrane protein (DUF373 family)